MGSDPKPDDAAEPHDASCATDHGRPRHTKATAESLGRAAALFQALGDAERLRLLELLTAGEACVSELVAATNAGFSTVSQRLRILRSEGLVAQRRVGKHVYYRLEDAHVAELVANALAHADEPHDHGD
ncbi:MAG: metalloregulator ArsR/SmtB family transcription factor [Polyangiaceae bacterium]